MTLFQDKYRVESARLRGWDYASAGGYFVTICTRNAEYLLGDVLNGVMHLSAIGEIAHQYWTEIPSHFAHVRLDEFVIMPNHVHGIVVIGDGDGDTVETRHVASLQNTASLQRQPGTANEFGPLKPGSLQAIVHAYKSAVTRWCRKNEHDAFAWQARFYDHIIRDEGSLKNIREYIANNAAKWELDKNSRENLYM